MFSSRFRGAKPLQAISPVEFWAPKWTSQLAQKWLNMWLNTGAILGSVFSDFRFRFGRFLGLNRAKKGQYGHKKDINSLKVLKNIIYEKCYFPKAKNIFCEDDPKTIIRGSGRLPRGTWRAWRPQTKRAPTMNPTIINFWASFGADLGIKFKPKMDPKLDHKWHQIHVNILMKFFSCLQNMQFTNAKNILFWAGAISSVDFWHQNEPQTWSNKKVEHFRFMIFGPILGPFREPCWV